MSGWDTEATTATIQTPQGEKTVQIGEVFSEAIKRLARELGYGHFRVYVNEDEILSPEDAPETIDADDEIKLTPEDKAA